MRPLDLKFQAFGPYATEQRLNFEELGANTLFLIWGPTGAGKTTILDAMCYALFGQSSGLMREPGQLRSHHAAPEVLTRVVFDFAVGTERYRVMRAPEQERPAKRGGGVTVEKHQATLHLLKADGSEGEVLAARPSDVDARVQTLLGFSADQFRQVVVLPQGQFQKFLYAGDKEREEILEILFRTDFYRLVEERLKEKAKQLKTAWDRSRADVAASLKSFDVPDRAGLEKLLEESRDAEKKARAAAVLANAELEHANKALEEGRRIDKHFQELAEAEAAVKAVESERKAYQKNVELRDRARAAAPVFPVLESRDGAAKEAGEARKAMEAAQSRHADAREAAQKAAKSLKAEELRGRERQEAAKRVGEVERLLGRLKALEEARDEAEKATKAYDAGVSELARLEAEHKRLVAEFDAAREEVEDLKLKAKDADAKALQEKVLAAALALKQKSETFAEELKDAERVLKESHRREEGATTARERAQRELERVERAWRDGQAARLAATLKRGDPCPVCGSSEHPDPAKGAGAAPSDAALEAARLKSRSAQEEFQEAKDARVKAERQKERMTEKLSDAEETQGEHAKETVSALKRSLDEVRRLADVARAAARSVPGREAHRNDLAKKLARSESELKTSQHGLGALRDADRQARAALKEREGEFPKGLQDAAALRRAFREAQEQEEGLKTALERRQKEDREAQKAEEGTREAFEAAADRQKRSRIAAEQTQQRLEKAFEEAGFASESDFLKARMTPADVKRLEREVTAWEESSHKADDRLARAKRAVEGKTKPELAALQMVSEEAKAKNHACVTRRAELAQEITGQERTLKVVADLERKGAEAEKQYGVVARVADLASGKNERGMSLNRFVLGARLDDVLAQASLRLTQMSRGRFKLTRGQERAHKVGAGGLELAVLDEHTGRERPVKTLSGGESFLASLCLALGLSDVVQANTGGIRLDSMVIDEGFGSLDAEALEAAMRALEELQRGGRLVGIISHVPELKERIPARLEVAASRSGSSARFAL